MSTSARPRLLASTVIAVLLAALLVLEYHGASSEKITLPLATQRTLATQPGDALATTAHLQADLTTILERPLFQPSRRPAAVDPAATALDKLPRLSGVMISRAGKWLIFDGPGGKPIVVTEGGHIGPYVVRSIGDGQATVAGPAGLLTVRPSFGNAPASVAVAQPSILDQLLNAPLPQLGLNTLPPPGRPAQ